VVIILTTNTEYYQQLARTLPPSVRLSRRSMGLQLKLGEISHPTVVDAAVELHNDGTTKDGLQKLRRLVFGFPRYHLRCGGTTFKASH